MGIDVHVLGTASARPTNRRDVSGSAVNVMMALPLSTAVKDFKTVFLINERC
jgi:hypothetical protein